MAQPRQPGCERPTSPRRLLGTPLRKIDQTPAERRSAYAALARANERDLLRTALFLCRRDSDWAKDLVQDVLIKGYVAYWEGRFSSVESMRAWMIRILTNEYIDQYRRRRKWDAGVDVDMALSQGRIQPDRLIADAYDVPGVKLLADTLEEPVERALMSLVEEVRTCVILVDIEGLSYAEAAAALRIPIGTVRSRLARGRTILFVQLSDYLAQKRKGNAP